MAETAVASIKERPGPRWTMPPNWVWCQGVEAFVGECRQSGERKMRLCRVRERILEG